jgi:hypothetical protein
MPRTNPRLNDIHPLLRSRVLAIAKDHRGHYPDRRLCLIWGHRTPAEQNKAYRKRRSRIDGVKRFGLHNYRPSLAADLWVYLYDDGGPDMDLHEDRPERDTYKRLCLLEPGDFGNYYRPMGLTAKDHELEWGGDWPSLRDGPHVQMNREDRIRALQAVLNACGFHAGGLDGIDGRKTRRAIKAAGRASGLKASVGWRQRRLMPIHPDTWAWLFEHAGKVKP